MFDKSALTRMEGTIAGCGFASGDRFVAGIWEQGPLGPMNDLMWAQPNGARVLLAGDQRVASYVGGVYDFDQVEVVEFDVRESTPTRLCLRAGAIELDLEARPGPRVFALRPKALRRARWWIRVEDVALRPLVGRFLLKGAEGVRGYGLSPSGVREWYAIDSYSPVVAAKGAIGGQDLGAMAPLDPPVRFGFSEFPRRPALVRCAPILEGAEPYLPSDRAQPSGRGRGDRR